MADTAPESRMRRRLRKLGFQLCKTTSIRWTRNHCGLGYVVVITNTSQCVFGYKDSIWDATLDEVAEFASGLEAQAG